MQCESKAAKEYIDFCISEECELFQSDGSYFWSDSLIERLAKLDEKRKKCKNAADIRWRNQKVKPEKRCEPNADALRTQCEPNAQDMTVQDKTRQDKKEESCAPAQESFNNPWQGIDRLKVEHLDALFATLWAKYPVSGRKGKEVALGRLKKSVLTPGDAHDINVALEKYMNSENVKKGFIFRGSKWFDQWRDWIDHEEPQENGSGNGRSHSLGEAIEKQEDL
jgi:hypothetical protein